MSRKARLPIILPKGVEAHVAGKSLTVKGPKGTLTQELRKEVLVKMNEGSLTIMLHDEYNDAKNFLGLFWALISNMVKGVSEGFTKELEMVGVGYRAALQGDLLDLSLGYSHPVKLKVPKGLTIKIDKSTSISVIGMDKREVGQFSADIRAKRPPEPYKGKGIRYKDEYVRKKAGKTGKK